MPLNRHLPTILKVTSSPLDRMTSGHRIRQSFDTSVCDVQRVPVDGQANVDTIKPAAPVGHRDRSD
ncbi:uncharacterized protein LOC143305696 isoform X6 [Osmia lignaria lignaria]|uniref:uncharacterized protein LOC143305696 isoform X6 n=1 Tax=Osmia lignaria lignaria TaxID=1437193 RepID=UPI00402B814F